MHWSKWFRTVQSFVMIDLKYICLTQANDEQELWKIA